MRTHSLIDPGTAPELPNDQLRTAFLAAVVASLFLPRLPFGRNVLYPFALLGTWAHELGHGLAAITVGGRFTKLELYPDLGGSAYSSGVPRGPRSAIVSAGGLLGPAFAGGLVIIAGSQSETAPFVLGALASAVGVSVVLVLRNQFGFLAMAVIDLLLGAAAWQAPEVARVFLTQFIGIQFCFASWGTLDYMFTKRFVRNGHVINSDTQNMADNLVFPYWFWAFWVAALSATILAGSFYLAWLRPELAVVSVP